MDNLEDYEKYNKTLKKVFNTEDGKLIREWLQNMYVSTTAFSTESDSLTMYRLGQKELIQGLFQEIDREL